MKPSVLLLFPLLFATACASKAPLTYNDDMIVPGKRVGEVMIGMDLQQLMALKGAPLQTIPIKGTAATTYAFDGLTVGAHDKVYWIVARDGRFHTAAGVAPGVEQITARAALGEPNCVASAADVTTYDYGDLYFDVDNSTGKVREVGVQKETATCG